MNRIYNLKITLPHFFVKEKLTSNYDQEIDN